MSSHPTDGPFGQPMQLPNGSIVPISPGFVSGGFLFLSGQLAFTQDGALDTGDIERQTQQCLENISALLDAAGATRTDVVKATVWLVNLDDFAGFNSTYAAFFGDHRPARSTVRADLLLPGARVEIEVIAQLRADQ